MNYNFHDKVVLRTPLKSFKTKFTAEEIKTFFAQKEVKEALFLASPDLCKEYDRWVEGKITDPQKEKKLISSLQKYAGRMHARCTPFGLFAGCTVVDWGEENGPIIRSDAQLTRSTRLDMHFSCQVAQKLAAASFVRPYLKFYPSTSIYAIGNKLRYIEYKYQNKLRVYQISAVDRSIYIEHVLEKAKKGARLDELAASLPEMDADISLEEAAQFIGQLVDEQLLISEIEPSVSGDELLEQILSVLNRIKTENEPNQELDNTLDFLTAVLDDLKAIDTNVFNPTEAYTNLAKKLETLDIPYELSKLFQTDLFAGSTTTNKLDKELRKKLRKTLRLLNRITEKRESANLKEFAKNFYTRYEDDELPLLSALDNELGVGYAQNTNHTGDNSPLVNDLAVGIRQQNAKRELKLGRLDSFLHKKLLESAKSGAQVVQLKEADFKDYPEDWSDLPESMSIMFGYHKGKLILNSVGGSSGINLLGRFASGNDEIKTIVTEIESAERQMVPNAVLAEIVHLPETRTGNILMRPSFREYEIPYLSKSDLPLENQIDLSDLYVSVQGEKVRLRSKRLNKPVVPRLGNAHNYSYRSLPVYHFLCDLQGAEKRTGFYFSWGALQGEFNFLPRVEFEDVVLSPATWNLPKKEFSQLIDEKEPDVAAWRAKWNLPEMVLFSEGDNELVIDFNDELSVQLLIATLKKRGAVTLKECFYDEASAIVRNEKNEGLTNEFIATLIKTETQVNEPKVHRGKSATSRNFSAGSEWLYYKLYCGTKTADEVLAEVIKPLADSFKAQGLVDYWFFIRYADPDTHIRVRFHFADLSHLGQVVVAFNQALQHYLENGLIWKVQLDTYQRELERYGENSIVAAEQIFHLDSQNIVDVLSMIEYDGEGEKIRWLFALRAVDQLLKDFNVSLEMRKEFTESMRNAYGAEFGMNKHLNKQIDKKFRANKAAITDMLNRDKDAESELKPIFEALAQKSALMQPLIDYLLDLESKGELRMTRSDLLGSLIHMFINRLFKNKQRLHELVIYDFLWKLYRSEFARSKVAVPQ